jgi:hypothetical protein
MHSLAKFSSAKFPEAAEDFELMNVSIAPIAGL